MQPEHDRLASELADRYQVEGELGRGGMATVLAARDLKHGRRVAIKVLTADAGSAIGAERFAREIRIAAGLSHPNILAVYDSGEAAGLFYYVMPIVEGESLRARIDREKCLGIDESINIACDVADALAHAHAQGVIHRDIKPENILLRGGHVFVADFGIARALEPSPSERLTGTGMSLGTAEYMSPEQAAGDVVDERADIYALGCTLYEMLSGDPPFTGANARAIMARHSLEFVPSLRIVRPAVPEELEAAVMGALEKTPADRYRTMDEFKRAVLGEAAARAPSATSRHTARYRTAASSPRPGSRRRSIRIAAAAGSLLVVAGAVGAWYAINRPTVAATDANRVAVLYFEDVSGGPLTHIADGLTESLIEQLSTVGALDVISKDGVRAFRGRDVPLDSVGRALQVGSIVRGSVEPNGRMVRVTVRLVDALSDADIGRKSFEFDTARVVALQGQIATQVVEFLRERLGNEVRLRDDRAATTSNQAWTLVERAGRARKDADSLAAAGAPEAAFAALARADSLLASAERFDGRWSKIPVLRANVMQARARQQVGNPTALAATIDTGLAHAGRAIRLQPNNADAFQVQGVLQLLAFQLRIETDPRRHDRLLAAAESSLTRAVELNSGQAGAWAALSSLHYSKPDIQAASVAALNAYRADAYLSSAKLILTRLFWTSHDLEQFPEALKWCNEGRRRFPQDPFFTACRLWMYTTRLERPDLDSAWAYRGRYVALTPENASDPTQRRAYAAKMGDVLVAGALARAGLADSARSVLQRARAGADVDPDRTLQGFEAIIRVILGEHDEAVTLLASYLSANPGHGRGFATGTGWWWRDLQSNPNFKRLIAGAR
ncbi:MAG TPA: serine/threonine-protein kinase [Gemmatimonadaceae bacterium]|nr:serine/threonine-protein kinase [Gemmatimonadaceae bacterium]